MSHVHDVLIIGSGLSALTAARALKAHKPLLLEARSRVGGRAHTFTQTEAPVDLGCSMIHGYKEGNPLAKTLQEFGLPEAHVVSGSQPIVIGANGPLSDSETLALLSSSASLAYSPTLPSPPPSASLASVLLPTLPSAEYTALARTTEIGAGIKLEELSAKWWNFGRGFGGTDGFPVGGYVSIVDALRKEVESAGGKIEVQKEVISVNDLGAEKGIRVTTKEGTSYEAKVVISTIPLAVLQRSPPTFSPALPAVFLSAVERTRVGVLEKVVLAYPSAWWPSPASYGQFLLLPTSSSTTKPSALAELFAQTTLNVSSFARIAREPHSTLLVYLGADAGTFISTFSPSEVLSALHAYLATRLPSTSPPPSPIESKSTVTNWLTDPFSLGATSAPVAISTSADGEVATPLDFVTLSRAQWAGRLGFAGEHTDLDNRGSAAGAVISGAREGERVKGLLERLDAKL